MNRSTFLSLFPGDAANFRDPDPYDPEAGVSIMEIVIYVAAVAIVLSFAGAAAIGAFDKIRLNQARAEIDTLVAIAQQYRQTTRSYANISVEQLRTRGYGMSNYTSNGQSENAYGLNIQIAPTSGNAEALVTYQANNEEACNQLFDIYNPNDSLDVQICAGQGRRRLRFTLD